MFEDNYVVVGWIGNPAIRWVVEWIVAGAQAPAGTASGGLVVSLNQVRQKDASHEALSVQFQSDAAAAGRNGN